MKNLSLALLFCIWMPILTPGPAEALDLWIVPGKFVLRPGERVRVFVNSGDDFPESVALIGEHRVKSFNLHTATERAPVRGLTVDGRSLTGEITAPESGTVVLALGVEPRVVRLKAKDFNDYLKADGLPQILAQREALGEKDLPVVERYSKWAKAIMKIGDGFSPAWSEPVGDDLEIMPEKNPYDLRAGEPLAVTVLYEGKPLDGVTVSGGRAGGSRGDVTGVTGADGRVSLTLREPGRWYIRTIHMIRLEDDPTIQWESFWATLTFEVQS